MGILNITPDSFSHDGLIQKGKVDPQRNLNYALKMINDGADIIDVGGESSRPGARPVSIQEELRRIIPTIKLLARKIKVPISVDTYKPQVARCALDEGASILNNIKGIKPNRSLLKMVGRYRAGIILMHMRKTPRTMQKNIVYKDLINDIIEELTQAVDVCLELGISLGQIVVDPGIGFGKTSVDNLKILNHLQRFQEIKRPILIGASRKSFIGKILKQQAHERLLGSAAAAAVSIIKGTHIIRVHDVKAMKEIAVMTDAIANAR